MIQFSANLGFLWAELALPDAIRAAKAAGFSAVECHWPFSTPAEEVSTALTETGLTMLAINTPRGDVANGENGIAAIAGREAQAQLYIDESVTYASKIGCPNIHVMAGYSDFKDKRSLYAFVENLSYACYKAGQQGKTILIEPLNKYDAPGYFLSTLDQSLEILDKVGGTNLKIMFDCYHLQIMGGDLLRKYKLASNEIGHVQFAAVPDRGEPYKGEVDFHWLLNSIMAAGYSGKFGAEYRPRASTNAGLGWMQIYQADPVLY